MKLESKRLILREWGKRDMKDLIEGLNNLKISKWLAYVPYPYTHKDAGKWINYCIKNANKGKKRDSYEFAIELKSEEKIIGGIGIVKISKVQGTAGGGLWLNAKYHGCGYGEEAFTQKINFAFNKLKLRRLENGFIKGNSSSFKMQKRLGYKIEGLKRKAFKCMADGKFKDEYITGLLKEEWNKK